MRANPSNFQAIIMKAGHYNEPFVIHVHGQELAPSECVKLLGIFIDNKLIFINISARYAHERLVKSMSWAEYLSSCPQIASPSCSTHSYCQTFCIVPFCSFLFKSWYVQNEIGSEKGIETITEWLYIIVLRTTRKCQPPPLCVPYRD